MIDDVQQAIDWSMVVGYKDIGYANYHIEKRLFMKNGVFHRTTIKLCHFDVCFEPLSSDGFVILSTPPVPGTIVVEIPESATEE